jgi:hypothetical protein
MRSEWQEEIEPGVGLVNGLKTWSKALIEIPVLLFLILTITMGFWLPVVAYLLVRTWFLGMGSLYIWAVLVSGLMLFVAGAAEFIGWSVKLMPFAKELRAAKRSGNKVRIDLALDGWRVWRIRRRFTPLWMAMLSIFLIIPAWVALAWIAPPQGAAGSEEKRVRAVLREKENRGFLPSKGRKP